MDVRPGARLSQGHGESKEWFYVMKNDSHYSVYLRNGSAFKYVLSFYFPCSLFLFFVLFRFSLLFFALLNTFSLHNHRCDCTLTIDGVEQGTFRLNPYCGYSIERPVMEGRTGRFTFVSEEAIEKMTEKERVSAGVSLGKVENGLVEARFVPEAAYRSVMMQRKNGDQSLNRRARRRGAQRRLESRDASSSAAVLEYEGLRAESEAASSFSLLDTLSAIGGSSSSGSFSSDDDGDDGEGYDDGKRRSKDDSSTKAFVTGATMLKGSSAQMQWRATNLQMAEEAAVTIRARLVAVMAKEERRQMYDRGEPLVEKLD